MNKYNDLELSILGCFLKKPSLLDKTKLENEHFIKHAKIFIFFKAVYKKFGTLDFNIMYSISKNKYRIIEYIVWISQYYGFASLYETYEQQLIDLYEETKKNKYIIEKVYELANDLYVRNLEVSEFRSKVEEVYKNADEIFKGDNKNE